MVGVASVAIWVPEPTAAIAAIVGVATPLLVGLLAWLVQGVGVHINSRMTELVALSRSEAFARGQLEGKSEGRAIERQEVLDRKDVARVDATEVRDIERERAEYVPQAPAPAFVPPAPTPETMGAITEDNPLPVKVVETVHPDDAERPKQ
jgi:hypothetical protein